MAISTPNPCYGFDESTPLVGAADAMPSAPSAYWAVAPQSNDVGQQPQPSQLTPPQQPGLPANAHPATYTFHGAQPYSAYPRPSYSPPHSHLPFVVITMVICCILNFTSLSLGIPAMILAITANTRIKRGQWKGAKTMASAALLLSIINWIYTLGLALAFTGSALGIYCIYYDNSDDKFHNTC